MQGIEDRQAQAHDGQIVVGDRQCLLEFFRGAGDEPAKDRLAAQYHQKRDDKGGHECDQERGSYPFSDAVSPSGA